MNESTTSNFDMTDNAAKRIAFLLQSEDEGAKLRLSVDGGGCSGFQYKYDFVATANDDDLVIEKNGATLLVDEISLEFINGSVLDYIETLGAAHFEVKNPNATANCGCGNSFSV